MSKKIYTFRPSRKTGGYDVVTLHEGLLVTTVKTRLQAENEVRTRNLLNPQEIKPHGPLPAVFKRHTRSRIPESVVQQTAFAKPYLQYGRIAAYFQMHAEKNNCTRESLQAACYRYLGDLK